MDGAGAPDPSEAQAKATECPVCNEDYTDPKLLQCTHLVCRKCVVDWLDTTGQEGGCPLCRHPILPPRPTTSSSFPTASAQDSFHSLVDAFPTELTMVGRVEGCKILSSRNVCIYCDNNSTAATAFCLQCSMKLCAGCAKGHRNVPALRNHVIEELNELTPERLAENNRTTCKSHEDRAAEMYCPGHRELICTLCARTKHKECPEVKDIVEAAQERRAELREETKGLREMETALRTKVKETEAVLAAMNKTTTDVFDQFQTWLDERRQELDVQIKAEKEQMSLPQLDADRASVKSNADVIDSWLKSAPDDAFLVMTTKMRPWLNDLKQRVGKAVPINHQVEVVFDSETLTQLKSTVARLGQIQREALPTAPTPALTITSGASFPAMATAKATTNGARASAVEAKPRFGGGRSSAPSSAGPKSSKTSGVELVKVLKVGDRVRQGPHWQSKNEDGKGQGTVESAPSSTRKVQGCDPEGFVDVLWDHGRRGTYRMGRYDIYDLELV